MRRREFQISHQFVPILFLLCSLRGNPENFHYLRCSVFWTGVFRVRHGAKGRRQTVCKPGSVRAPRGAGMAIHLGRPLPDASRDLPGRQHGNAPTPPLLGLAPGGVYRAAAVTGGAVRSYRTLSPLPDRRRSGRSGGLLSVALSLGSPPPGVTRHRVSVEPGLSSPRRRSAGRRPSDRLAPLNIGGLNRYLNQSTCRRRPASSAVVSSSQTPSIRAGLKCRWKAATAWRAVTS